MALAFADDRFATQIKLTQPINGFGSAVDIDGNTAAVAGSGFRFSNFPEGAVYVYVRESATWTLQQSLTARDDEPEAEDSFGWSVALNGNTLVVGAMGDSTGGLVAGAAYVYVRDGQTWSLQQKLIANDAAPFSQFGISVDITEDTIVVGAYGDDDSGYGTGAAYIFHRDGVAWTQEQKLKASDEAPESSFGLSVSISGQTIAIGSPSQSSPEDPASGAVYVFVNNGDVWEEQQKIKANIASDSQQLGFCVAISGDTIVATAPGEVVGVPSHETVGVRSHGAAYIFERTGTSWDHQKRFFERDVNRTGGFAVRAAIDGDTIIVGDPANDSAAVFGGATYVYVRNGNGWTLQYTLTANDAHFLGLLGFFMAISGDTVILGAPSDLGGGAGAYIFQ